jgi:hypothetical protein
MIFFITLTKVVFELIKQIRIENEKKLVETKQQTSDSNFFDLYVELLVVTDPTVYEDHKRYSGSNDSSLIFSHMRTYFAHTINLVITLFYCSNNKLMNSKFFLLGERKIPKFVF